MRGTSFLCGRSTTAEPRKGAVVLIGATCNALAPPAAGFIIALVLMVVMAASSLLITASSVGVVEFSYVTSIVLSSFAVRMAWHNHGPRQRPRRNWCDSGRHDSPNLKL